MKLALTAALATSSSALLLDADNYDELTAGKTVFLKFYAPWCGHCKKLAPAWKKLMDAFEDHETALVAHVDCTAGGKPLCDNNGVRGFPTLKYGDPMNLEDYEGKRDFEALETFSKENLKPSCGPTNMDLCDDEAKAEIEALQALSTEELDAKIAEKTAELEEAEKNFKDEVDKLQKKYESLSKAKDAAIEAVKSSGLGLMKSVAAASAAASADKDEL
jgi:protein disulfide-isomerase-like protein